MSSPTGRMADVLTAIYDLGGDPAYEAFMEHLTGGTSAEWLVSVLTANGIKVGATTLKTYRAAIRETGV